MKTRTETKLTRRSEAPTSGASKKGRIGMIVALAIAVALLCASPAGATDVTIAWQETGVAVGNGYLPRVASDGPGVQFTGGNLVSIYQTGTGFDAFDYASGYYDFFWNPPASLDGEIGHAPSIAMVQGNVYEDDHNEPEDFALEVHQGGQNNGSALWYRAGIAVNLFSSSSVTWQSAHQYDDGYNPTVAVDQYCFSCTGTATDVVEVHQGGVNQSQLWYHTGTLVIDSATPTVTWSPSYKFDPGFEAYAPTVSIANGLVLLVGQGSAGELWYSLGVLQSDGQITWGTPKKYDNGYNPTVSLIGCKGCGSENNGFEANWDLVEAHQALNNTTGALWYRTGRLNAGTGSTFPTAITWTPNAATQYATEGCYPSLTQFGGLGSTYAVVETNSTACDEAADIVSSMGELQLK